MASVVYLGRDPDPHGDAGGDPDESSGLFRRFTSGDGQRTFWMVVFALAAVLVLLNLALGKL